MCRMKSTHSSNALYVKPGSERQGCWRVGWLRGEPPPGASSLCPAHCHGHMAALPVVVQPSFCGRVCSQDTLQSWQLGSSGDPTSPPCQAQGGRLHATQDFSVFPPPLPRREQHLQPLSKSRGDGQARHGPRGLIHSLRAACLGQPEGVRVCLLSPQEAPGPRPPPSALRSILSSVTPRRVAE